jgi:hypothetical protein
MKVAMIAVKSARKVRMSAMAAFAENAGLPKVSDADFVARSGLPLVQRPVDRGAY